MSFAGEAPSPHSPAPALDRGGRGEESAGGERRARTSPQPPPVRAAARASTSRDSPAHRHRKVTGKAATLHNLPPRRPGTCKPGSPPSRARAGRCGGGGGAARWDARDPPAPAKRRRAEGGGPRAGFQRGGRGGRCGARPRRARRRRGSPAPRRPSQLRPGPPRGAPVTRLT